ncbi:hypothetical protein [Hyalangium sp.]|uniref:hypothetical protein n=1 Tax=Hyalangium sp. TaxID=2028555 RepID=UPI002D546FEF|nr:hypothetical protein [Hyalangium sp.]HYH98046.1 hypothetical protein [Hyalangium sp.]
MRRPDSAALAAVVVGVVLGLGVGCEPIDPIEEIPPGISDTICYRDSDCAPNGCCGEGTHPTHVSEAPNCSSVRCTGTCEPNSIDCGRCIAVCRDSRCAAACQ